MVMMLLCIVAAIATPALRGFSEGRKIGSTSAQIVSLGQWARSQAVTRGVGYRLNVDPATGTFWLTTDSAGVFVNLNEEFGKIFTVPDGVTLQWYGDAPVNAAFPYVEFLPTGRTTAAAYIELTDERGSVLDVACRSPGEPLRVLADWERFAR